MKTTILTLVTLLSLNSFALDTSVGYTKKGDLTGISGKVSLFKVESLNNDNQREFNFAIEPELKILEVGNLELCVAPSVGVNHNKTTTKKIKSYKSYLRTKTGLDLNYKVQVY